ncbi:MAG: DUF481 domain-containing protein [Pyrinomonadaceae bacterium]
MNRFISALLLCALLLSSTPFVYADQIILKNGDRLTGKIVKKDGDKVVIETESAGTVAILWSAVQSIKSDEPVNIELKDGQLIKGTVATKEESKLAVTTESAGVVEVDQGDVEVVRNNAEQTAFEAERERLRNPGILDLWSGSADVGFSLTSGNSETKALTVGARAARVTTRDKISVYANAIQASNSTSGESVTTAQAIWFGGRYDVNLNEKTFVFGTADFEYDKPQQLDFRTVFGGGFGYRAIRSERTALDVFGGAAFNREYFSDGTRRNSAEVIAGEELKFKIAKATNLEQRFVLYPNISRAGSFRSTFDATVITSLSKWLGWQVTLGNRYNSDPIEGAKSNDFLFSTGLRATFGRN